MAELNTRQFAEKIRAKAQLLAKDNYPLKMAAQTIHALRIRRIFHEGVDAWGLGIGTYNDTKELWVSDKQLRRRGTHEGKPFDSGRKLKSGKNKGNAVMWRRAGNKTSYYKSYKALKEQQGFDASKVNLRMTNNLQSEFANTNIPSGSDGVPKNAKPEQVTVNLYVERIDNVKKMEGLEKKYGNVFGFTKGERKQFMEVYNFEATKILQS